MSYKLGSLFDGSGGFPLSGTLCDIEPVWAAEVEPYPIAVTSSRFPNMKHLGDISKVNGAEIEPVDIITFGSPCQDLSVAGKRAGLKHEDNGDDETTRSGLFMEAVRIIKEMRKATNGEYPKFCCWENVPGAFSSNNGEDFRIVLQELIKIAEPYAVMPEVPKKGWAYADSFCGDGWSLAYRVFDAQYWGVPQRRRRIYLVTDFGGERARKILFEREGLRGYFTESGKAWETVAPDAERSLGADDREGAFGFDRYNQCSTGEVSETVRCPNGGDNYPTVCYGVTSKGNGDAFLSKERHTSLSVGGGQAGQGYPAVCYGISSYDSNSMKSSNPHSGIYEADTSRTLDGNGGNPSCNQGGVAIVENIPYTLKIRSGVSVDSYGKAAGKGPLIQENKSATLGTSNDQYLFQPIGFDGYNATETGDKSATLGVNCGMSTGRNGVITDTHILDDQGGSVMNVRTDGKAPTIRAQMGGHPPVVMVPDSCVAFEPGASRRLGGYAWEDVAGTLRANMGDNQTAVAYGVDAYNQTLTGDKAKTLNSAASDADHVPCTVYSVENHPADSRVNLDESGKVQTLTSRMGTGGGNVPMVMEEMPKVINLNKDDVQSKTILDPSGIAPSLYAGECRGGGGECYVMEPFCKSHRSNSADDATTWKHAEVANTLNAFDQGEARANEIIVMATQQGGAEIAKNLCPTITAAAGMSGNNQPVAAYGLDRASFNQGQNAKFDFSILDEQQPTLTARGPGAVCCTDGTDEVAYSFDPGASRDVGVLFIEECGKTLTNGTCPGHHDGVVISRPVHSMTTGEYMQVNEEKTATLLARDYKDPTCVEFYDARERRYIVRRLTPTECARLQGFPDKWGHVEPKTELTDEEYRFWLNVRKTHDAINGRPVKDYNEKQMLAYYNKLWTDSAEYKMWGNGIALNCALYVMQGIKDALVEERTARSKWLDELLGGL